MVLRRLPQAAALRPRLLSGLLVGGGGFVAARHVALLKDPEVDDVELTRQEWDFLYSLARRSSLLVRKGGNWVDVEAVRKWHIENNYLGGIVLRQLAVEQRLYVDPDWKGISEKARRECYYLYYEISGAGRREQHLFIRGSHLLEDLIIDLQIGKTWDEECGCYIHTGFRKKANVLLDDIIPLLDRRHALILAGHSMGGAMAVIIAMKLTRRGYNVDQVVTFGAPKVITNSGCEVWRGKLRVLRVVHHDDPIPTLPMLSLDPHIAFDRYAHFGTAVLLLAGPGRGTYVGLQGKGSESYLVDSFWLTANLCHPDVHRMRSYKGALKERATSGATRLPYRARWDRELALEAQSF